MHDLHIKFRCIPPKINQVLKLFMIYRWMYVSDVRFSLNYVQLLMFKKYIQTV